MSTMRWASFRSLVSNDTLPKSVKNLFLRCSFLVSRICNRRQVSCVFLSVRNEYHRDYFPSGI